MRTCSRRPTCTKTSSPRRGESVTPSAAQPTGGPAAVEPVDDTAAPVDPHTLLTAAPEQQVDTTAAVDRAREAVAAAWDNTGNERPRPGHRGHLTGRGLDPDLAGYAPAARTTLVDHLHAEGFGDGELLAAGLARTGNRAAL